MRLSISRRWEAVRGKQGQARIAAVEAIQVGGVLHTSNTKLARNANARGFDALLLLRCELMIIVLKRRVNLVAGGWSARGKGKNAADGTHLQQSVQFVARANQRLEADFLVACAQPADDLDGGR